MDPEKDQMFSHRLDWQPAENPLARAESARRQAGAPLIDLTESNPTVVGIALADGRAALGETVARTVASAYLPTPFGDLAARRAVADVLRAQGANIAIEPERVILTVSSSESYALLIKLLCDPGDALLVPEPSYPLFEYLARLEGVAPQPYRLGRDGGGAGAWPLDLASIERAHAEAAEAGRRVGAIVLVSPNNPTGSVLRSHELDAVDAFAADRGIALVADEVFADYVPRRTPDQVACAAARAASALTFSLGGLSKSCGLPQVKLGWIAAGGPRDAVTGALARLELICDTYLSVSSTVQAALPALLALGARNRAAITARIDQNRRALHETLGRGTPLTVFPADGGWTAIVRLPNVHSDEAWALMLLEHDSVLVHPGYFFDLRDATTLVLSLLPEPAAFAEGIARLLARVIAALA